MGGILPAAGATPVVGVLESLASKQAAAATAGDSSQGLLGRDAGGGAAGSTEVNGNGNSSSAVAISSQRQGVPQAAKPTQQQQALLREDVFKAYVDEQMQVGCSDHRLLLGLASCRVNT
jgi:hypothetical protein